MTLSPGGFEDFIAMAGIVAFAVSAVMAVVPRGIDLFGACMMAVITTIGGGTVRDVILGVPIFWTLDLRFIWVALTTSVLAFYGNRFVARKWVYRLMLYIDALGVALFAMQAAQKVQSLNFAMPLGPILLGVLTAIGGGLLRDMLAGNTTLLMSKDLYVIPVTIGCCMQVFLLTKWPVQVIPIVAGCVVFTFALRSAAIHWNLSVPRWMTIQAKQN